MANRKCTEPDITGQRFGRLVAIEKVGRDKNGRSLWNFQCDCGTVKALPSYVVRKGRTISCGCYRKDPNINLGKNLLGKRFGRLVVLERIGTNKCNQNLWKCKCDCGNEVIVNSNRLCVGKTRSCGCLREENNKKHGLCYTRLYSIHSKMKERCLNKTNPRYEDYGGRGVLICDEWIGKNGFESFYKWATENGYSDDLTLDRINVNGNYEPSNCRWADNDTQANNTRRNVYLTHNGETHTMVEWSRILNIPYGRLQQRIYKLHWSAERALTEGKNGSK